jgi:hypothetical protein
MKEIMSNDLRARLYEVYEAFREGRIDSALKFFDENAVFTSYAPVDIFPHLGRQVGKPAIAAMMANMHAEFEHLTYSPIFMVAERDAAAAIIMVRLRQRSTNRIIHLFSAHFVQSHDGMISEIREFMDSFDAVQQVLGRELDLLKQ